MATFALSTGPPRRGAGTCLRGRVSRSEAIKRGPPDLPHSGTTEASSVYIYARPKTSSHTELGRPGNIFGLEPIEIVEGGLLADVGLIPRKLAGFARWVSLFSNGDGLSDRQSSARGAPGDRDELWPRDHVLAGLPAIDRRTARGHGDDDRGRPARRWMTVSGPVRFLYCDPCGVIRGKNVMSIAPSGKPGRGRPTRPERREYARALVHGGHGARGEVRVVPT
jgi:hypothetical protein